MAADPDKSFWGQDLAPPISSIGLQKIAGIGRTLRIRQGEATINLTITPEEIETRKFVSGRINSNRHDSDSTISISAAQAIAYLRHVEADREKIDFTSTMQPTFTNTYY